MHTTQAALLDQHQVLGVRSHSANDVSFPAAHWTLYMKEKSGDVAVATAPRNPSWRQTTFASFKSHPEPQTPPQDPLKNTSTRPWDVTLPPPANLTVLKKIKKRLKLVMLKIPREKLGGTIRLFTNNRNKRATVKVKGSVGGRGWLRWRVPWGGGAPFLPSRH